MNVESKERLHKNLREGFLRARSAQVLCGVQSAMDTGFDLHAANQVIFLETFGQPSKMQQFHQRANKKKQEQDSIHVKSDVRGRKNFSVPKLKHTDEA